jgi:hypothetical protein
MNNPVEVRRATVAIYLILAILPTAILTMLVFEPPGLSLSYVFSAPHSRPLAFVLSGLAVGSLVVAALVPRSNTHAKAQLLMIPGGALVGLAFGWGLLAALLYTLGLLFLILLRARLAGHDT